MHLYICVKMERARERENKTRRTGAYKEKKTVRTRKGQQDKLITKRLNATLLFSRFSLFFFGLFSLYFRLFSFLSVSSIISILSLPSVPVSSLFVESFPPLPKLLSNSNSVAWCFA